jgi:hypothetical protein
MPHLSDIASDCPLCGERERFTGRTRHKEGRTYAVLRCRPCRTEGLTWQPAFEPVLDAYWATRQKLQAPQRYDLAWVLLRDRDPENVRTVLHLLRDGLIPEAPLFRLEEMRLPHPSRMAQTWTELALTYPGFRPAPSWPQRIEEALAAALHFDVPSCAKSAATHLDRLDPAGVESVLQRLPRRVGDISSAKALVPFFQAVATQSRTGRECLHHYRMRWSIPALREAARLSEA